MSQTTRHGGPIDPFSPYSLYDILDEDVEMDPFDGSPNFDFYGFHLVPQGNGRFHVQYDGHAGSVMAFDRDDYDDVLELVDDLVGVLLRAGDFDYRDDKEGLVEWAGKIMTSDKERALEEPDLYIHIPDDVPPLDGE